jgi:predicted GIY-YIG superfamily endonuclease
MVDSVPWFCYMLRCRDGALYVGVATDLELRVKRHNWESERILRRSDDPLN